MSSDRIGRDELNIQICELIAKRTTCQRGGVGCVVTKNHRIVSSGYNGPLIGLHCSETNCDVKNKCQHSVHAEANAICAAARHGISLVGATLYCLFAPCYDCSKLIVQSGIIRVVYKSDYHSPAFDILAKAKIEVVKFTLHDEV